MSRWRRSHRPRLPTPSNRSSTRSRQNRSRTKSLLSSTPFEGLDPDFEYLLFPTPGADGEGYLGPFAAPDTLEPCRDPENPEDSYWLAAPGDPWGFLELGPNGPRLWAHQGCMRTGPVPMLGAPQAGDDAFALEGSTTWNASTSSFVADGRDTLTVQISDTAIIVHDGDQNVESAWGGRVDLDIDHDNVSEEIGWAESADGTIWISVIRRVNTAPTVTEESHLYGWNDDHGMVRVAFAERSMTRETTDIADGTSTGNTVSGCAENGRLERAEWSRLESSSEFIWFGSAQQLIWTRESSTTESVDADPGRSPVSTSAGRERVAYRMVPRVQRFRDHPPQLL